MWTLNVQSASMFLGHPFLLAFRCGRITNKRRGAKWPQAQSAFINALGGPPTAFFRFSKRTYFFLLAFGFATVCSISAPHWRGKWFRNRTPCIHSENVGAVSRPSSEKNKINRNQPRATQTRRATRRRATRQNTSAAKFDFV